MELAAKVIGVMATVALAVACGGASSPLAVGDLPSDDPVFVLLEARQHQWCEKITGRTCAVYTSSTHPDYAAWVDWSVPSPTVFWNQRVLTDRQFWITDPRMAHEACHLKHGLQPDWTPAQKEQYADWCALAYAGSAP